MIDIFMALWNQKHTRGLLKILSTFFLIGIAIFLVMLGMPRWSFSKETSPLANNATSAVDDSYITATATPDPTRSVSATPTRAMLAPLSYPCGTSHVRNAKARTHKSKPTPSVQHNQVQHNGSTPTSTFTPMSTASPTPDSTASATATAAVAAHIPSPTSTVIATTATPAVTTPSTAISTETSAATRATTDESGFDITEPSPGTIGADPNISSSDLDPLNVLSASTPVARSNRITPRSNINIRVALKGRQGNCLSNSLEGMGVVNVVDTLVNNASIIIGGSLAGTILFYIVIYTLKRRKRA